MQRLNRALGLGAEGPGLCPTLPALVGAGRLCHMLRVQIGFPMPCLSEAMQMETPSEKPSGCLCPGQVCLL